MHRGRARCFSKGDIIPLLKSGYFEKSEYSKIYL